MPLHSVSGAMFQLAVKQVRCRGRWQGWAGCRASPGVAPVQRDDFFSRRACPFAVAAPNAQGNDGRGLTAQQCDDSELGQFLVQSRMLGSACGPASDEGLGPVIDLI